MALSCNLPNPKYWIQIKIKVEGQPLVSPWARLGQSQGVWKGETQVCGKLESSVKAAILPLTVNAYKIRNILNAVRVGNTVIWLSQINLRCTETATEKILYHLTPSINIYSLTAQWLWLFLELFGTEREFWAIWISSLAGYRSPNL